jgi:hypothetical protein
MGFHTMLGFFQQAEQLLASLEEPCSFELDFSPMWNTNQTQYPLNDPLIGVNLVMIPSSISVYTMISNINHNERVGRPSYAVDCWC